MKVGELKFYSYGTVAENKDLKDKGGKYNRIIKVVPMEKTPFVDGEITGDKVSVKSKGTDSSGAAYNTELDTSLAIDAEWIPMGTSGNMRTAPDVRRGATVSIYQFANTDKYFWITLFDDVNLRKLETVVWGISATKDEAAEAGPDNMYYFEISSHGKLVHFHTSQANGEKFGYDFQIDTDKGNFSFRDTDGNIISVDSVERRLEMINGDGSYIDLHHKDLKIFTAETVSVETKTYNLKCETSNTNATTTNTTATTVNLKATDQNITAKTKHTGNVSIIGDLGIAGSVHGTAGPGGGGDATFDQALKTKATFSADQGGTFGGTVNAKKVVSTEPISAPNV